MRIFIDCTLIDFTRQPTGIPRVVLNYINAANAWAVNHRDIEIIPCVSSSEGLHVCDPAPGSLPPQHLIDRVAWSKICAKVPPWLSISKAIGYYVSGIIAATLGVIAAIIPTQSAKSLHLSVCTTMNNAIDRLSRLWSDNAQRQLLIEPQKGDVVFCPAYWHDVDPKIYKDLSNRGALISVLVHDILPISHERFYPAPWKYHFKDNVIQIPSYATVVFTVSNYTRECLFEFFQRNKVRSCAIYTAYNGFEPLVTDEGFKIIENFATKPHFGNSTLLQMARERSPYIMVGSVEPKKGHVPTVQCFELMWDAGLERELVIVGRKGWMDGDITDKIEGSRYYGKKLFWYSNIDDFDLAALYINGRALIFSSVAEGFGIPMIEASHYGMPSIVFESQIAREVIGEYGYFFEDAAALIEHVEKFEQEDFYRLAQEHIRDFKWHSWDEYLPRVFDRLLTLGKGQA